MLTNYKAKNDNEVTVSIDDEIEVLDDGDLDYWFIDNLSKEKEGVVPSYLVQEITEEEFKHLPKDKQAREREARNQRKYALTFVEVLFKHIDYPLTLCWMYLIRYSLYEFMLTHRNVVNDLIDSERKYVKLLRFVIEVWVRCVFILLWYWFSITVTKRFYFLYLEPFCWDG